MARLKILLAALSGCLLLAGCNANEDGEVYRELLTEALWLQDDNSGSHYFNFTEEGIVYIFPVGSEIGLATEHRYIFDPVENKMAIQGDEYGLYDISKMDTERIVMKETTSSVEMMLCRCKQQVKLPEHKGNK